MACGWPVSRAMTYSPRAMVATGTASPGGSTTTSTASNVRGRWPTRSRAPTVHGSPESQRASADPIQSQRGQSSTRAPAIISSIGRRDNFP